MADSRRVVYAALIGNLLIALTKFMASAMSGSSAMFSEAIHSLVDSGNEVLLLNGLRRARMPATARHPFGYGRELYFWAFVVALLIFGLGAGLSAYEGVRALGHPHPLEAPLVNYGVLGTSVLFEGASWVVALREFRRTKGKRGYFEAVRLSKDPATFSVLLEDTAALLGLVVALAGVACSEATGDTRWDAGASLAIAALLAGVALILARECRSLLIGESADRRVVEGIRRIVSEDGRVLAMGPVLTLQLGADEVLLTLAVEFTDALTTDDMEEAVRDLEGRIKQAFPAVRRIFIEAETLRRQRQEPPARRQGRG